MTYQTTVNPLLPAMDAPIASAPVRGNFQATANDINFIYSLIATLQPFGAVSSVGISGSNGIGVSGSPITSSGVINISLGAITPTSIVASGTIFGSNLSGTNTGDQTFDTLPGLPFTIFAPTGKFSPLKFLETDGYANGQPDISRTIPTFDASVIGPPSYTTAKQRSIAIISVAGTYNSISVSQGDLLMALKNNPTLITDWAVIKDSSSDFATAVQNAQGSQIGLFGTYYFKNANPDAQLNLTGDATIFYGCNIPGIFQASNDTYASNAAIQSKVASVTTANYPEPKTGVNIETGTRFTMNTIADAANYHVDQMMIAFCDTATPDTSSSSAKCYIREAFRVRAVDTTNGYIYADKVLQWNAEIASSTNIYINNITDDRAIHITGNIMFAGAPFYIGNSVGWWQTLIGDQVTSTITGNSGANRTISSTAHNLLAGKSVQVGTVSGSANLLTTCLIASISDANTFVITVPATTDYSGSSPSIPTSGTLYYAPSFIISDATSHGAALVVENANGSQVSIKHAKPWSMGVNSRFSSFCNTEIECFDSNDPYTFNNNVTGRLIYQYDDYAGCENTATVTGRCGRHAVTTNLATTTSAWNASFWNHTSGNSVNLRAKVIENNADGGGSDSHQGANGTYIESEAHIPARMPYEGSYQGFGGNIRGSNEIRKHTQRGGFEGLVFRAFENQVGSVHQIDVHVSDIPYVNTSQMAIRTEALTAITNKFTVVGKAWIKNCGVGVKLLDSNIFRLFEFYHLDIAKYGAWVLGSAILKVDYASLSYALNTSGQSTRNGFVMEGASTIDLGYLDFNMGSANNPVEIFTDNDNTAGKTITVGVLNISDPSNIGIPNIITAGRSANFTVKIGVVIYNGVVQTLNNLAFTTPAVIMTSINPVDIYVPSGSTDVQIQAAMNTIFGSLKGTNQIGTVHLQPGGTYTVATGLIMQACNVSIDGHGSVINASTLSTSGTALTVTSTLGKAITGSTIPLGSTVKNFQIIGDSTQSGANYNTTRGIHIEGVPLTSTTLNGTITSGATSLTVNSATNWPTTSFTVLIGSEYILLAAGSGTTRNITTRGYFGSTPASHTSGTLVTTEQFSLPQLENVDIHYFNKGLSIGDSAFFTTVTNCNVANSFYCLYVANSTNTAQAENIKFHNCDFYNGGTAVYAENQILKFYACSFDYCSRTFDLNLGTSAEFYGCHVEFNYGQNGGDTNNPINIHDADTMFLYHGGRMIYTGSYPKAWNALFISNNASQTITIRDCVFTKISETAASNLTDDVLVTFAASAYTNSNIANVIVENSLNTTLTAGLKDWPSVVSYNPGPNWWRNGAGQSLSEVQFRSTVTGTIAISQVGVDGGVTPKSGTNMMKITGAGHIYLTIPVWKPMQRHAWGFWLNAADAGGSIVVNEIQRTCNAAFNGTNSIAFITGGTGSGTAYTVPLIGTNTWGRVSWKNCYANELMSLRFSSYIAIDIDCTSMTGTLYLDLLAFSTM